jgi:hypothetical protein
MHQLCTSLIDQASLHSLAPRQFSVFNEQFCHFLLDWRTGQPHPARPRTGMGGTRWGQVSRAVHPEFLLSASGGRVSCSQDVRDARRATRPADDGNGRGARSEATFEPDRTEAAHTHPHHGGGAGRSGPARARVGHGARGERRHHRRHPRQQERHALRRRGGERAEGDDHLHREDQREGTLTVGGTGALILTKDSDFTLPTSRQRQKVSTPGGNHPYTVVGNPDPPAITVKRGATLQAGAGADSRAGAGTRAEGGQGDLARTGSGSTTLTRATLGAAASLAVGAVAFLVVRSRRPGLARIPRNGSRHRRH